MELSDFNLKYFFICLWINVEVLFFFWCGLNYYVKQFEVYYFIVYVVYFFFLLIKCIRMIVGIYVLIQLLCYYNVDQLMLFDVNVLLEKKKIYFVYK